MKDLKHTTGKWSVKDSYCGVDGIKGIESIIHDPEGKSLPLVVDLASINSNLGIESEANAKLIAAAPFMLQMLQEIAEGVGNGCHRTDIHSRAIEAIKKATD